MTTGLLLVFITFRVISANSPVKFEETKADSVASGSANLGNSCASFAESDLANHALPILSRILIETHKRIRYDNDDC